jgi:hypothetical protein
MDTGTTKYQKFLKTRERRKKVKNHARALKIAASKRENQRKHNQENGHGYLTNKELQQRVQIGKNRVKEFKARIAKKRKEGLERYYKKKRAERRERERLEAKEKKAIQHQKEIEKRKMLRKKATESRRKKKKIIEKNRRRLLKHPIWQKSLKPYKIYVAINGHCLKNGKIGIYRTLEDARDAVREARRAEEDIIFERLTKTYEDGTMPETYEYVIFKDVREKKPKSTYLKNEYGKYVEHNVSYRGKNYEIIEKYPAKVEDTVWVFGYDPRNDRKTFAWVYENVLNEGFSDSFDMKRIYLYHNKVVFRNDKNKIDIIICKTAKDAVRYYITLQKYCKKGPYLFMGAVTTKSALCPDLEKLLLEKTGWALGKLRRNQHRF